MIRTQIQLTEEQFSKVKKIAAHRCVAMAEVIRGAIDGELHAVNPDRREQALNIVGKFRSGKRDVSTRHDAYLAEVLK